MGRRASGPVSSVSQGQVKPGANALAEDAAHRAGACRHGPLRNAVRVIDAHILAAAALLQKTHPSSVSRCPRYLTGQLTAKSMRAMRQ